MIVEIRQTSTDARAVGQARSSHSGVLALDVPQMIREDELLFWTPEWRDLEGRALAQIDRGEAREFANFRDLALWLLSDES